MLNFSEAYQPIDCGAPMINPSGVDISLVCVDTDLLIKYLRMPSYTEC